MARVGKSQGVGGDFFPGSKRGEARYGDIGLIWGKGGRRIGLPGVSVPSGVVLFSDMTLSTPPAIARAVGERDRVGQLQGVVCYTILEMEETALL